MSKKRLEKEYADHPLHSDDSSLSNAQYLGSLVTAAAVIIGLVWLVFSFSV